MKKLFLTVFLALITSGVFAQMTPNALSTDEVNPSGVGYTRCFYQATTDGNSRIQAFNATASTTVKCGYIDLGTGLSITGNTLNVSGVTGPAGPAGATGATGNTGSTGATGHDGPAGPANSLAIGTVASGVSPAATITGTAPSQTLNLVLQKGDTGAAGAVGTAGTNGTNGSPGAAGPANTLTIGTVTQGTAAATITGTSPNQTLNLVLQKGDTGIQGVTGTTGATGAAGTNGTTSITQPTVRSLVVSTSYQSTDVTKVAVLTVGGSCTNNTTLLASSACTLTPRIGTGTLTCSTGTAMPALSVTVALGLVFTSSQSTPYVLELPAGASVILCPTAGTWTLDVREQLRG